MFRRKESQPVTTEMIIAPTSHDLERVVGGQVDRYVKLGFHKEVYPNLMEEEAEEIYRKDLKIPEFAN